MQMRAKQHINGVRRSVPVGFLSGVTTMVSWLIRCCQVEGRVRVDFVQLRDLRHKTV